MPRLASLQSPSRCAGNGPAASDPVVFLVHTDRGVGYRSARVLFPDRVQEQQGREGKRNFQRGQFHHRQRYKHHVANKLILHQNSSRQPEENLSATGFGVLALMLASHCSRTVLSS